MPMGGMMPPGPGIPPLMPGMPPGRSVMSNSYCGELNYIFYLTWGSWVHMIKNQAVCYPYFILDL